MALQIVTDSSSDLPIKLAKKYDIRIVPLYVNLGNESYPETELSLDQYWDLVKQGQKTDPPLYLQTSQPTRHDFSSVFSELVEQENEVICITLTSKHSGTFDNANSAAGEFNGQVTVFDSQYLTWGLGFMALEAAKAAKQGASRDEVWELLQDIRNRTHVFAILDTLKSLRRGGRANGVIGTLDRLTGILNLKPIVNFVDGKISPVSVGRRTKGALQKVINRAQQLTPLEKIAVVHTRRANAAEAYTERIREATQFGGEVITQETGAVLASHAGRGAIALAIVEAASQQ